MPAEADIAGVLRGVRAESRLAERGQLAAALQDRIAETASADARSVQGRRRAGLVEALELVAAIDCSDGPWEEEVGYVPTSAGDGVEVGVYRGEPDDAPGGDPGGDPDPCPVRMRVFDTVQGTRADAWLSVAEAEALRDVLAAAVHRAGAPA